MSNPSETPTSSSVKKQVRRFAPTLRGRGRGSRSAAPSASETSEPTTSSTTQATTATTTTTTSTTEGATQIGHLHSETSEGRLPSVHGPKTRGGAAKVRLTNT
jgi:Tfp pilus assembly major pilin PilA